ncbi:Guanine nucleotide-binding protein alpha-2 subunit [Entomophthora muscae]|uniref:Guanine nucleotide-binding protein alpha-2 subunit n=1 Tax=Entomophthora muscae TaxID=34485 RepID=A0ACC2S334_9FUNG|nr:Guanine nucleotide-binding protein alpha-2 subunit [Entomophthora muscae]
MKKASYIDHNKIELVASLPSIYSESAALTPSTPVPKRSRSFFRFFPVIMGACLSAEERVIRERNTQIDRIIEEDSKRFSKECKILLLGIFPPLLLVLNSSSIKAAANLESLLLLNK